nr:hypothetical protein GCM10020092_024100 [Actinoplanes digitatis]
MPGVPPGVGDRLLREPEDRGADRRGDVVEVAGDADVDGRAGAVPAGELLEIGDARAGRELGQLVAAQDPDHAAHLGEGPGRLGLDHPQRVGRGVRMRSGGGEAGLRPDRHRRHVVRDGVVQVPGQPLAFEQLDPLELAEPGGGPVAQGETRRDRRRHHHEPGEHVARADLPDGRGPADLGEHDGEAEHDRAPGPPPDQGVNQDQDEGDRVVLQLGAAHRQRRERGDAERDREHRQRPGPPPQQGRQHRDDDHHRQRPPLQAGPEHALDHREGHQRAEQRPVPPHPRRRVRGSGFGPYGAQNFVHLLMVRGHQARHIGPKY